MGTLSNEYKDVLDCVTTTCKDEDKKVLTYMCVALGCNMPILEALFITSFATVKVIAESIDDFMCHFFQLFYKNLNNRGTRILEQRGPWHEVFHLNNSQIMVEADWTESPPRLRLKEFIDSTIVFQYTVSTFVSDGSLFATQLYDGCYISRQLRFADKFLMDFPDNKKMV